MSTPPCKDCESRHIGCHSICDKYKNWKDKRTKELKEAKPIPCRASLYDQQTSHNAITKHIRRNKWHK